MSIRNHAAFPKASVMLLAMFALPALMHAQAARDVKVVNTPSVHVTNTPSVNVVNTPTVNVGNTPTVNVANIPNVSITNTAAKPAVVSNIDDPGRIPYQSTVDNTNNCTGSSCSFLFTPAAPGHRVVIQHISGLVDFTSTPNAILVMLNNGNGAFISSFFAPVNGNVVLSTFDQPVQAYFDATQLIQVQVSPFGSTFAQANTSQIMTLTGYQLDCTASACAPIAH